MFIEGTYTLQASPEHLWQYLLEQEILQQTIPGIEQLERIDENTYHIALQIKHAPLKGMYAGQVTITERQYPQAYHIAVQGKGSQSIIHGDGDIRLQQHHRNTIITYQGSLTFDSPGKSFSPTIIKGAAKMLIQQFFAALAAQLRYLQQAEPLPLALGTQQLPGGAGTIPAVEPTLEQTPHSSFVTRVVHWFRKDKDYTEEILRWEKRIKRFGMIAVLLFLFWVGTRLPRKR